MNKIGKFDTNLQGSAQLLKFRNTDSFLQHISTLVVMLNMLIYNWLKISEKQIWSYISLWQGILL